MVETNEERTVSIRDYLSIAKRRRWPMLIAFLGIMLLSVMLAFGLPALYRSTAIIEIKQQEIPEDLVRSTITSFADERIQRITQQAMTSLNLSRIIEQHNLYEDQKARVAPSEIIEDMRQNVHMELVSADVIDPRSGRPTQATIAFTLAFDHNDPALAQKVTSDLVTLYQSVNLDDRLEQVEGTADYLQGLSQEQNARVLDLEDRLAKFKQENSGALPEYLGPNLEILQRFERDKTATEAQLGALKNRIIFLEAQLLTTNPHLRSSATAQGPTDPAELLEFMRSELRVLTAQYGSNHPDVRMRQRVIADMERQTGLGGQADIGQIDFQIEQVQAELDEASGRYGEQHPEIGRLRKVLANLQDDRQRATDDLFAAQTVMPAANISDGINVRRGPGTDNAVVGELRQGESATLVDSGNASWYKIVLDDGTEGFVSKSVARTGGGLVAAQTFEESPTSPAYVQLQANLSSAQTEAESLIGRYAGLQQKVEEYTARINQTPLVEREYSALTRDLNEARMQLADYTVKAEQARRAVDIERSDKAQQFRVLEPPIAPVTPNSPNRPLLLALGFILSLFGPLGAAAIAESMDTAVRSPREIFEIAGMAPLAAIPYINTDIDSHSSRRGLYMIVGAALALVAVIAAIVHFAFSPLDVLWFKALRALGL